MRSVNKKTALVWAADLCLYIAGGAIYSAAVLLFLSANEISPGGLTGVATVLNYLFMLPVGTVMFLLNIPILIIGFIKLGGIFILKTTVSTVIISVILDVFGGIHHLVYAKLLQQDTLFFVRVGLLLR